MSRKLQLWSDADFSTLCFSVTWMEEGVAQDQRVNTMHYPQQQRRDISNKIIHILSIHPYKTPRLKQTPRREEIGFRPGIAIHNSRLHNLINVSH